MLAAFSVIRLDEPARLVPADNHLALGHERRLTGETPRFGRLRLPHGMSGPRVNRHQRRVSRRHKQLVVVDGRASLRSARERLALVLPDDVAASRIDCIDPIELRDVHHAVGNNRYGLDRLLAVHVIHPFRLQRRDVGRCDLLQQRVPLRVVRAGIHDPILRVRLQQTLISDLGQCGNSRTEKQGWQQDC